MRCRYCNIALATSRSFVDGEFCCDDHRQRFELEEASEPEAIAGTSVTSNFAHAIWLGCKCCGGVSSAARQRQTKSNSRQPRRRPLSMPSKLKPFPKPVRRC